MSTTIEDTTTGGIATVRPRQGGLIAGALAALAVTLAAVQVLATHIIPPLAVFAIVFTFLAVLIARRPTRWVLIVVGLAVAIYLAGSVPFVVANLAHPESPVSFLAEAFVLIGSAVALIGVVGELRGSLTATRRRYIVLGGLGLAGVAIATTIVASAAVDSAPRGGDDIAIETSRSMFPSDVEVPTGPTTLWFDNQDPFHHTVVIDGTGIREVLPASSGVRVDVDLAPGTYRYWCDVPGHETMEGTLHVG